MISNLDMSRRYSEVFIYVAATDPVLNRHNNPLIEYIAGIASGERSKIFNRRAVRGA